MFQEMMERWTMVAKKKRESCLSTSYQSAIDKIEDPQDGHLIKRLFINYQDIFLRPGDTLQVAKAGWRKLDRYWRCSPSKAETIQDV
jgi:hypothetical protein